MLRQQSLNEAPLALEEDLLVSEAQELPMLLQLSQVLHSVVLQPLQPLSVGLVPALADRPQQVAAQSVDHQLRLQVSAGQERLQLQRVSGEEQLLVSKDKDLQQAGSVSEDLEVVHLPHQQVGTLSRSRQSTAHHALQ